MQEFFQSPSDPKWFRASTTIIDGRPKNIPETSLSQRRDWAIRTMIEQAVACSDATVHDISKRLAECELTTKLLLAARLDRPFVQPGVTSHGSNNDELRKFAHDAYDQLSGTFTGKEWRGWFIAPYFVENDDLRESFYIGVFVDQDITETVVE